MSRTYWIAINKVNNKIEGGCRGGSPHLYLGKRVAMAAKRGYQESDESILNRYTFKEIKLIETVNTNAG